MLRKSRFAVILFVCILPMCFLIAPRVRAGADAALVAAVQDLQGLPPSPFEGEIFAGAILMPNSYPVVILDRPTDGQELRGYAERRGIMWKLYSTFGTQSLPFLAEYLMADALYTGQPDVAKTISSQSGVPVPNLTGHLPTGGVTGNPAVLRGRVLWDGKPLPNIQVMAIGGDGFGLPADESMSYFAFTDVDGTFSFTVPPNTRYSVGMVLSWAQRFKFQGSFCSMSGGVVPITATTPGSTNSMEFDLRPPVRLTLPSSGKLRAGVDALSWEPYPGAVTYRVLLCSMVGDANGSMGVGAFLSMPQNAKPITVSPSGAWMRFRGAVDDGNGTLPGTFLPPSQISISVQAFAADGTLLSESAGTQPFVTSTDGELNQPLSVVGAATSKRVGLVKSRKYADAIKILEADMKSGTVPEEDIILLASLHWNATTTSGPKGRVEKDTHRAIARKLMEGVVQRNPSPDNLRALMVICGDLDDEATCEGIRARLSAIGEFSPVL